MSSETIKRKQFLFVDDDAEFLAAVRNLFSVMSGGAWEIFIAESHAQALGFLQRLPLDVVVVDIGMPVMNGLEFLRLLDRTHPGQQVVMLTGLATEENRKACLENGAALFLEKPASSSGFAAVFAALQALAGAQPQAGFRGMLRRVGLQEVLQLECLGRKSSVLEIFTEKARGRIFICDGSIVHAESGALQGEVALYGLLALRGGDFNFLSFTEPPRRTIEGHWESLLMEAARLSDEGADFFKSAGPQAAAEQTTPESQETEARDGPTRPVDAHGVRIEELVLCTGAGEVLYDWECKSIDSRLRLLEQVEQQARELSSIASVGRFDRLEILSSAGRVLCQVQPHMRLFVRSAPAGGGRT